MDSQCTSVHQKDKSIGSMLMFTELNEVWHQSNNIIINKLNFINMIIALAYIIFFCHCNYYYYYYYYYYNYYYYYY